MHLIVDGYGSDPQLLQDEGLIFNLLDRLPDQIGMKKVTPPFVFRYVGSKPRDWGLSAFVLIAESHIAIHTFVERHLLNVDLFSCKEFDAARVVRELKEKFRLTQVRSCLLDRGLEYPDLSRPLSPLEVPLRARVPALGRGRGHEPR